jgi:cell cycle arrest protein BUB3
MTTPLENPPSDGVTRLRFCPTKGDYHLAVGSWDKTVRIYDALQPQQPKAIHTDNSPVLDVAFLRETTKFVSVGLSKKVSVWTLGHRTPDNIGKHDEPIRAVEFHPRTNQIFTGSWDRSVKAFDNRTNKNSAVMPLQGKVFCMHQTEDKLVIATSDKKVVVFDVRNLTTPQETRDSPLKFQIRSLQCFPDGKGFLCGSVEGRVAWEYFEKADQKMKYAFKCHRKQQDGEEIIHSVHALSFHPLFSTFATGGGDGVVSVWDGLARKRLWRLPEFETSISSLAFSADGLRLGIAVSYTYEDGPKPNIPANRIFLRNIPETEMKPKPKQ